MAQQPNIVTGTGAAVTSRGRSNVGEDAMTRELQLIQQETDRINARPDWDDVKKNAEIAALNDPANVRSRMLRARDMATGKVKA